MVARSISTPLSARSAVALLLGAGLLTACGTDDPNLPKGFSEIRAGAGPSSVDVVDRVTPGGLAVHVRVLNEYGAAVPAGSLSLSVEGESLATAQTVELVPDAGGHAFTTLDVAGTGANAVTVTQSADGLDVTDVAGASWVVAAAPVRVTAGAIGWLPELADLPSFSVAATGGIVFSVLDQVWYQSGDPAQPAWQVLDMPQDIVGMESGHIDRDGVLDLLVWGGNQVVLLKGRAEGGFSWKGGWQAGFGAVAGGAIADVDTDRNTDVVIAATGGSQTLVVPMMGDGAWGFAEEEPLFLATDIYDMAAADEGYNGVPVVSVLSVESSSVRRYTLGDEGWVGAATSELPGYGVLPDSTFLPMTDLNGDRRHETLILSGPEANTQDVVMFEILDEGGGAINYPVPLPPLHASTADMDLDGSLDIVASVDDAVHVIGWDGEGYVDRKADVLGERGPVAGAQMIHDEVPDLSVVTDAVTLYPGSLAADGEWALETFSWTPFNTALLGPALLSDYSSDGLVDVVGFTTDTDLVVAYWTLDILDDGSGELQFQGRTENAALGSGAVPYGLVECSGLIYALTEGAAGTQVSRIDLSSGDPVVDATASTAGTLLACGLLPSGEPGVVVAQESGFWRSYGIGLTPKEEGTIDAVGAIALADSNGDGFGEVVGCAEAGCSVVAIDPDGDGTDAIVVSDSTGTRVSVGGVETTMAGSGLMGVGDIDLDGIDDVVAWDPTLGRGVMLQAAGAGLAPGPGFHTTRLLASAPSVGDMTGDGVPELIFVADDGTLWHSEASSLD